VLEAAFCVFGVGNEPSWPCRRRTRKNGERKVLLNLAGVSYVDSSGIGELTGALASMQKQGGQLKLFNPTSKVAELLRTARLYSLFDVKDDENSAIQSVSGPPLAAAG